MYKDNPDIKFLRVGGFNFGSFMKDMKKLRNI